jgi:hypothetical protein
MRYRIAADFVLLAHFLFAAFAVFGGLLLLDGIQWAWLHLPVVAWSAIVNLKGWTCPLTPVEQRLRTRAGQAGYAGGFIQHYVGRALYPGGMPRRMERIAGWSILAGNALVYAAIAAWRVQHLP